MSSDIVSGLTIGKIDKRIMYDPTSDLESLPTYIIQKSGNSSLYQQVATTNASDSQITWTVNPDKAKILDRYMLMQVDFDITFTGPTPGVGNLIQDNQGLFAVRSWPLNSCITSATIVVNNQNITTQPALYISSFQHARLYQKRTNIDLSSFPSLPDNCQDYNDMLGANNNPLAPFTSSFHWQQGRGAFPYTTTAYSIAAGPPSVTTQTIRVRVIEPLMLSPLLYAPDQAAKGFAFLTQFQVQVNLGNLNRCFSLNTTSANSITSVSTTISRTTPVLYCRFITPDIIMPIPKLQHYAYENIGVYQTGNTSLTAGATSTFLSNNINLSQIPSKIYVYARRQDADLTSSTGYQYADAFAELQSISVTFNNNVYLSSASEVDLWRMSVANGINLTWGDWIGNGAAVASGVTVPVSPARQIGVGSICCIEPYKDFGLPSNLAPGVYGEQFNFQLNATFKNISGSTITYSLFVVLVQDGVLTIERDANAVLQLGTLTQKDILDSSVLPKVDYHQALSPWGGDFFSSIKKFVDKALPYVKEGIDIGTKLAPLAPLLLAAGDGRGGALASREELRKRIRGQK